MVIGAERAILLPERVGMLRVCAEVRVAKMAVATAVVNCMMNEVLVFEKECERY